MLRLVGFCAMDWQLVIVGGIVAVAGGYLARTAWRTWTRSLSNDFGGCAGGCARCATPTTDAVTEPPPPGRISLL